MARIHYWLAIKVAIIVATALVIRFIIRSCFKVIGTIGLIETRFAFMQTMATMFAQKLLIVMLMVKMFLFIRFGSMIGVETKTLVLQTKWFITMQVKLVVIKIQD